MKRYFAIGAAICAGTGTILYFRSKRIKKKEATDFGLMRSTNWKPPSREKIISNIKEKEYDLLIIGGGSVGSGCALEAVSRGLSVALVETNDFASGSSSKSTNMLHGGVRYLESAVKNRDLSELMFVQEGLYERKNIMRVAPHLTKKMKIIIPIYKTLMVPYMWLGMKVYDWISGTHSLGSSGYVSKRETKRIFPNLFDISLKGAISYFDGIFNDARLNISVILAAMYHGADCINYVKMRRFIKKGDKIVGAVCQDRYAGDEFEIRAKGVICGAGPLTDKILSIDNKKSEKITSPSRGTHIVLDKSLGPNEDVGILVPTGEEGRVIFCIPWLNHVLFGTTDVPCKPSYNPLPIRDDIDYCISQLRRLVKTPKELAKKEILSAWTGIRPLILDKNSKEPSKILRKHHIDVRPSGLICVAGGKWTIYRKMGEEVIETAIKHFGLTPKRSSISKYVRVMGGDGNKSDVIESLKTRYDMDYINHLYSNYGSNAIQFTKPYEPLHKNHPFSKEEIEYQIENEMVQNIDDILARRTRLACLDVIAAYESIDTIAEIFKKKKNWTQAKTEEEKVYAKEKLNERGLAEIQKLHKESEMELK